MAPLLKIALWFFVGLAGLLVVGLIAVAILVIMGNPNQSDGVSTSNRVRMSADASRLNVHWQEAVGRVISQSMPLEDERIYAQLENRCKDWEWPKARCQKAFADLLAARERYFAEQERVKAARDKRTKKLGYD